MTDWFGTIFVMRGPSKLLKKVYHSQTIHAASMCIAKKLLTVLPHNLPDQTDEEFDAHSWNLIFCAWGLFEDHIVKCHGISQEYDLCQLAMTQNHGQASFLFLRHSSFSMESHLSKILNLKQS